MRLLKLLWSLCVRIEEFMLAGYSMDCNRWAVKFSCLMSCTFHRELPFLHLSKSGSTLGPAVTYVWPACLCPNDKLDHEDTKSF